MHNMLAGATGIDFVLLVVAADDGVMPQTREHLAIMDLLGLSRHGLVALNKCDLAGARISARQRRRDVRACWPALAWQGADIVPVSAVTGDGHRTLAQRVSTPLAAPTATRAAEGALPPRRRPLVHARGRSARSVTGTVLSGVGVASATASSSAPRAWRPASARINAQNRPVERGEAGQRCALVLSGPHISKEAMRRGDVVLDPGAACARPPRIDASLRVLPSEPRPIGQWLPVRVHHAAADVPAPRGACCATSRSRPGETEYVQLVLERRSRPRPATASSFATLRRAAPSAAAS